MSWLMRLAFYVWLCGSANAQAWGIFQDATSGIVIGASESVSSCTAPCGVFFDYTGTTATFTSYPFHELYYSTNFGDSGAGNWSYGSSNSVDSCGVGGQTTYCTFMPTFSRNIGIGGVVGHVYASPGTYTPVVTVTGASGTATKTLAAIVVADPATIYGGNWTGSTCNFGGANGSPATSIGCTACVGVTLTACAAGNRDPKSAGTTFAAIATNYLAAGTSNRVLFHATETFNGPATCSGTGTCTDIVCSSCQLGSFDSGAQPILQSLQAPNGAQIIGIGPSNGAGASNISLQNLQIDAAGDGNGCMLLRQNDTRILVFNVTCTSATTVVGVVTPTDDSARADDVYVNSVSWHGSGAVTGNGAMCGAEVSYWRGITRLSMLGLDFEMADSMSQSMTRLQSWDKIEIGHSYYGRPCPQRSGIDIRGDTAPQASLPVHTDRYANVHHIVGVQNSEANGGGNPITAVQPQSSPLDDSIQDLVFDTITCWFGITSANGCIQVSDASQVTIRNYIANGGLRSSANTVPGFAATWDTNARHPQPQLIWWYHNNYNCNTANITGNGMIALQIPYVAGTVFAKNNINYCASAPNVPTLIDSSVIDSGSYVSATGVVTLHMNASQLYTAGATITVGNLTGTGAFAMLAGTFSAASVGGTGPVNSTVTYNATMGLGAAAITGGTIAESSSSPVLAGNSDQVGGNSTTSPQWSNGSLGFSLYSDYAVGRAGYVHTGASGVPVFFDFAGVALPASPTIGALQ